MATSAQYAATAKVGIGQITVGDYSRTLPTTAVTVFTAGASGSRIDQIDLEALGTTTNSMIRLWIYDGSNYKQWKEFTTTANTPTPTNPVWSTSITTLANADYLPLILPTNYSLRATINDTQITQAAQVDSLVANGTLSGVVTLGNSKFTTTAASTAACSVLQTTAGAAFLTQTATPYVPAVASVMSLTSTGNISAVNFSFFGTDASGAAITEVLAGPNNNTVYTTKVYATITNIYVSAAVGTNTSVGIASSVTFPTTPTPITISSSTNVSAINFTIRGTTNAGVTQTETLAGPVAGATVTSANTYKSINYVSPASSATTTGIGTPNVITTINVIARGGDL